MFPKTFLLALFLIMAVNFISAQTATPLETGVSLALAKWRAANYSDVRYKLDITLEKGAPLMKGEIEIRVKLTDEGAKNDLILDWRTTAFANDKDKPFAEVEKVNEQIVRETVPNGVFDYQVNKEHLVVSKKYLKTGENVLQIKFASPIKTSGSAITRYINKEDNAEYIYSLFVPSDASTAFPVFDQPDLKARFTLTLRTPVGWNVISNENTVQLEKEVNGEGLSASWRGTSKHSFKETKPISTYVFAFAAGEFAEFKNCDYKFPPDLTVKSSSNRFYDFLEGQISPLPSWAKDEESIYKYSGCGINAKGSNSEFASIYVRKSQAEKFLLQAYEVFRLNREGVKFLESYFDYKFPFPKYDLVLIPEFPFGGMEHAGATFLRESSVIFPTEPTKNDYVSRANVIFHEAAHQWFGDTVTMKWFDDLWLKEGFAEFMAYKTLESVLPEYNAWKIFYERNKQAAYLTDSTKGTTPIYQEIKNLSAAKSAYGNIVYRKAPSFLKQAEFYLGEKEFQTAVRSFLKNHQYANAEWTDLVKEFETASKQDLKDWANVWVKQRNLPSIRVDLQSSISGDKADFIELKQQDMFGNNSFWEMKLQVLTQSVKGEKTVHKFGFSKTPKNAENANIIFTATDEEKINFIFPNYQDYGYGIFLLDEKSRAYVLANIQTEKDDFLRAMMWGSLWDSVREGELDPKTYVELVIKNLNLPDKRVILTSVEPEKDENPPVFPETDESTVNTLLGRVGTAMNNYLSEDDRKKLALQIERVLQRKIVWRHAPMGERITAFRAYVNLASTAESRLLLKSFLKIDRIKTAEKDLDVSKKSRDLLDIPPLRTKDRFDIVAKLLILGDEDAPALLAELEKTETSDEAKRYAYAAKAGIGTAENKAKFWSDFTNNKELSESWIEAAFANFNAPRHSDLTLPYLEKALIELPNLKKNRKIFFVNGWLAAFIGGQKSETALNIVNKFLADNPNLDKDLKLKILENADTLERAVKIRRTFAANQAADQIEIK